MQTRKLNNRPNGTTVPTSSFSDILKQMMKITKGGNLRVANQSWDIYAKPINNTYYNSHSTGV